MVDVIHNIHSTYTSNIKNNPPCSQLELGCGARFFFTVELLINTAATVASSLGVWGFVMASDLVTSFWGVVPWGPGPQ